jgi:hypothetical protein
MVDAGSIGPFVGLEHDAAGVEEGRGGGNRWSNVTDANIGWFDSSQLSRGGLRMAAAPFPPIGLRID